MKGFPAGSHNKESTFSARETGLIPGLGRAPGEGYCCLENPMDRTDWLDRVH